MALDTDRRPAAIRWWEQARGTIVGLRAITAKAGGALVPVREWIGRLPLVRYLGGSLLRRIFVSNLLGLLFLILGILYLSQHHAWLIEAKVQSLKVQGEITAAAIAANAVVKDDGIGIDPDKLPEAEGSRIPFRDDGFAALELSIRPERVAPVLRKLVQPTNNRARIYGRDGTLIVDSAMLLSRGQVTRSELPPPEASVQSKTKTKNFWTRLFEWLSDRDLPVYREIGSANGMAYPEVRIAMGGGGSTAILLLNEHREQIVSVAVPIQRLKAVQGVLLLSTRPGEIEEVLNEERTAIMTLAALALAATIAAGLLLARTVADPMRRLSEAAEHVSRNIGARHDLPDFPHRTDEVAQMAKAFRAMTAALYRRVEASDKFAADVAHELKNPLTAARSTAEALAYAKTDEQRDELVTQIQGELKRLNRLITDVSKASRLDAELALQQTEPLDLTNVLEGVVCIFRDKAADRGVKLLLDIAASPLPQAYVVNGNDGRLAQVVTNLVDNAISFSPTGTSVRVLAVREGETVEVRVEDEGPGIEEDKLAKVFERFYTYRPTAEASRGDNSGLGLSISSEIVRAHRGEIWAENRYAPGEGPGSRRLGARFVVRLPVVVQAAPARGLLSGLRH